jgi:prepilin-type N-terminal cleavage/methylation domain-containing protein
MIKNHSQFQKGFTLIEVMVAVGIFAIVVTIGLAALLSINVSYTNSRAQQAAMDQLNFAMETMSREIRTGFQYYCGDAGVVSYDITRDCPNGGNTLGFITFEGEDGLFFRNQDGVIEAQLTTGERYDLTPESIFVDELTFRVFGTDPSDDVQASVLITLQGTSQIRQEEAQFTFQTLITQRRPDLVP